MPLLHALEPAAIRRALLLRDLTDPALGLHAMQTLVDEIQQWLSEVWGVPVVSHRANPVVTVEDNYDRLHYSSDAVARDSRYTRYLSPDVVLRTHTSAMIPSLLERISEDPPEDVLLSCPGIVYRRDSIDRHHTGEPHQIDLWRIRSVSPPLDESDLEEMVSAVVQRVLPERRHRTDEAEHPYTLSGRQIDVEVDGRWLEVGECGLAHPDVLSTAGLRAASGLAMGLGLDRLLMLRKGMDDIRLIRATDPRVANQMLDLDAYQPVSCMPAVVRDLSIAVAGRVDAESLGDRVREALADDASAAESVQVLSTTPGRELPAEARSRLGMRGDQLNVVVRVVLRRVDRTLTTDEANRLRDTIYGALHEGGRHQWASGTAGKDLP